MSQYTITRACGHQDTINITGTDIRGRRQWIANRMATEKCRPCACLDRQQDAARVTGELGLPVLAGSPRQVAWADGIRARTALGVEARVEELVDLIGEGTFTRELCDVWINTMRAVLTDRTDASWWIDNEVGIVLEIYRLGQEAALAYAAKHA